MLAKIFNDIALDREFKENGYIIVDILSRGECDVLRAELMKLDSGVKKRFYASLWSSNKQYRLTVDSLIKKAFGNKVKLLFHSNYAPFFSDVLIKKPSFFDRITVHQDWTFVDESRYQSIFIWCPLVDVDKHNGCLQVVPKSHRVLRALRGANVPQEHDHIKKYIERKYKKRIELPAGKAVIFSQAMLHASGPNHTFNTRVSAGLLMLPVNEKIYHYVRNASQPNVLNKYVVDYDFFMNYNTGKDFANALYSKTIDLPNGVLESETVNFNENYLTAEQFDKAYNSLP